MRVEERAALHPLDVHRVVEPRGEDGHERDERFDRRRRAGEQHQHRHPPAEATAQLIETTEHWVALIVELMALSILDADAEARRIDGGAALALGRLGRAIVSVGVAETKALIQTGGAHVIGGAWTRVTVHARARRDAAGGAVLAHDGAGLSVVT